MKTPSTYHSLGLALCASLTLQSAHAVSTVTQEFDFPEGLSSVTSTVPDTTEYFHYEPSYEATVTPFNTNLGVLESVTLQWTFEALFSGVSGGTGSVGVGFSGNSHVGVTSYDGNGTGGGNGATSDSFSMAATPMSSSRTFTAAQAGVTYDPAIWAVLAGSSPYSAKWTTNPSNFNYRNVESGTFSSNLGLEVSYNYTPSPVPEPASALGTLGLLAGGTFFRRRKQGA
jgi:hypothetical protein